jgi:hypothetical protein
MVTRRSVPKVTFTFWLSCGKIDLLVSVAENYRITIREPKRPASAGLFHSHPLPIAASSKYSCDQASACVVSIALLPCSLRYRS